MATPERLPIANRSRKVLSQVMTRGVEFDLAAWALTRDIAKYSTDFMGGTIDANIITTGGAGTGAALVTTGESGAIQMVTGASDNQCSVIYLAGGNFVGNQNPVVSCRIKSSAISSGNVQFGFSDSIAAGVLTTNGVGPFVSPLTDPPTLTSPVADAVALTYDLSSLLTTPARWRLAYSRASTAAVVTGSVSAATIASPTASTYQWLTIALQRIDLATDQMAVKAYINGVQVAFVNTAVISNTAPLYPFLLIGATSATSRTLTCDHFEVYQDRDTSA